MWFRVALSGVKKRQFRMVIRVVKKSAPSGRLLGCLKRGGLGWLLKSLKKGSFCVFLRVD